MKHTEITLRGEWMKERMEVVNLRYKKHVTITMYPHP
jgi:hypothetical protein